MRILVKLSTTLRDCVPGYDAEAGLSLDMPEGTSVRELARHIHVPPEEIKIVSSNYNLLVERDRKRYISDLTKQMTELAKNLEFEKAALIRDEIQRIKDRKDLTT